MLMHICQGTGPKLAALQVVQQPGQAWLNFSFDQAAILRHFAF